MTNECEKCGIDLSEIADKKPQIELRCHHDGTIGLELYPEGTAINVHPGDALEIRWRLSYPEDGGPPTIKQIGWEDGHWGEAQGDHDRTLSGANTGGGTSRRTIDSYAEEGTSSSLVPDSFEKLTGYRAWIIGEDDRLHSTAHRDHTWAIDGPEVAICQKERDGHHVSFELFRLREEAATLSTNDPRRPLIQANIDREIMVARRSPERNCQCGIYAVHEASEIVKRIGEQNGMVYGRVKAWGKIADYEKGFRAEKVEIDALFRPSSWAKRKRVRRLAKIYGVSVEAPPYKLPDSDISSLGSLGLTIVFWMGFLAAGIGGATLFNNGVFGYAVATASYIFAALVLASIFNRLR